MNSGTCYKREKPCIHFLKHNDICVFIMIQRFLKHLACTSAYDSQHWGDAKSSTAVEISQTNSVSETLPTQGVTTWAYMWGNQGIRVLRLSHSVDVFTNKNISSLDPQLPFVRAVCIYHASPLMLLLTHWNLIPKLFLIIFQVH